MKPIKAIVFDAYGTLFDVHSVEVKGEQLFPGFGQKISQLWRQKQLEYTWLRSLMGRYEPFWQVTEEALAFTLKDLGIQASEETRDELLREYLVLRPYSEVPQALEALQDLKLAILSNGSPEMLQAVVKNSGLDQMIKDLISVDDVKIFKPSMVVYQQAPQKLGIDKEQILFVSSNSWDAAGAKVFGFQVCWINRFHRTFDELNVLPDLTIEKLDELAGKF